MDRNTRRACGKPPAGQELTRVTYDRRTIPSLLNNWAEDGRPQDGVIFVDEKTILPANIGALVEALVVLAKEAREWDWTDQVCFRRR